MEEYDAVKIGCSEEGEGFKIFMPILHMIQELRLGGKGNEVSYFFSVGSVHE